jgi:Domain of unknown function (DUF4381)/BatD DUF11 like domain
MMRALQLGLASLLVGLMLWTHPGFAADAAKVDISSKTDHTEITIGDRLHYTIEIRFPKEGRVELPSVLGNLGAFEIKDYQTEDAKTEGERRAQTWKFTLSTFTVGDYVIPPQIVEYRQGQDTTAQVFMTQPIAVKVKRTSPETVKDIADISGPEEPAVRRPWWLLLAVVLLGGAAWLAWHLRRRGTPKANSEAPSAPPYEEAMAALRQINAVALLRQNKARELCFDLSHILRRYVSRRFGIDALESTSSEFIELVATLPLSHAQKPFAPRFCEITDPVKFAGAALLESEAGQLIDEMRRFFDATRPVENTDKTGTAKNTPAKPGEANP